jgi:hypothetical protein
VGALEPLLELLERPRGVCPGRPRAARGRGRGALEDAPPQVVRVDRRLARAVPRRVVDRVVVEGDDGEGETVRAVVDRQVELALYDPFDRGRVRRAAVRRHERAAGLRIGRALLGHGAREELVRVDVAALPG